MDLSSLKNEEIKDAIEKLEDVTRLRLLCDEIIPKPMKKNYSIGNYIYIIHNSNYLWIYSVKTNYLKLSDNNIIIYL